MRLGTPRELLDELVGSAPEFAEVPRLRDREQPYERSAGAPVAVDDVDESDGFVALVHLQHVLVCGIAAVWKRREQVM